jgi:hypothetical protein
MGAVWHDGDLCFTRGPGTRKARNLASNPACTISVKLRHDLTPDGEAARVTEPAILQQVASIYRGIGCPAEAAGHGFTAPYWGAERCPAAWHVYQFTFHIVIGLSATEPNGATRWRFSR